MKNKKSILSKGFLINDKYRITFFLKGGDYAESYRVKDELDNTRFLKLFAYSKLHRTQFNDEGDILEIEILKQVNHPNIVKYRDNGELLIGGQKYAYAILDFISGETLADKMKREQTFNPYDAKNVILGVLNGLNYLHTLDVPIVHNEITNLNIMLDLSGKTPVPKIIDFGYARYLKQSHKAFNKKGLNPYYLANETFNKVFSVKSDLFSVSVLYYHLLFGLPPWFKELSKFKSETIDLEEVILEERENPLKVVDTRTRISEDTLNIITKGLQTNPENRFSSAKQFIEVLNNEISISSISSTTRTAVKKKAIKKEGNGFDAIAGMQKLKDMIQLDVIDALNDRERYAEYGLTIPNGILLYGPPGCGKTFFAEKLAEEIGFNFYQIKPSDIQSKWVNASQENIKQLFEEAIKNAPSIIFLDELDALVPNRNDSGINHMNTSAVNEFLAQMNNIGDDGVFIIGATNRPNAIDTAILRAGRLDKIIYIPPPDFNAREQMFKIYLSKRPVEIGLDYPALAQETENFVSSDIKFLCDEAARKALKLRCRISKEILFDTIKMNKPSISIVDLNKYEVIKAEMEGSSITKSRPIGFNKK